jgi:RNA polymerase sigma-70 factor (ECF subfamily)
MEEAVKGRMEELITARYTVLGRLQVWDEQESWRDFFETFWRLIYSVARKSDLTETEAQEVVHETVICAAKDIDKLRRDRSHGSFKSGLRNLTSSRIAGQVQKREPKAPAAEPLAGAAAAPAEPAGSSASVDGFEKVWEAEWQSNLFETALERVKHHVKEEHFQIFDLNVLRHWPAKKVAQTLGVHTARICLAKHRVLTLLKKELRRLEEQW